MIVLLVACAGALPGREPVEPGGAHEPRSPTESVAVPPPDTTTEPGPASTSTVPGEPLPVCINELMAANVVASRDEGGVPADWIELHNPTGQDVPLDGWSLTDDPTVPDKHVLGGGLVLEAGGFLVLWADHAAERGPAHLGFALSEDGEAVALFAPDGTGSVLWFGPMLDDVAAARVTDCCSGLGEACFEYVFAGSPGASNEG